MKSKTWNLNLNYLFCTGIMKFSLLKMSFWKYYYVYSP